MWSGRGVGVEGGEPASLEVAVAVPGREGRAARRRRRGHLPGASKHAVPRLEAAALWRLHHNPRHVFPKNLGELDGEGGKALQGGGGGGGGAGGWRGRAGRLDVPPVPPRPRALPAGACDGWSCGQG